VYFKHTCEISNGLILKPEDVGVFQGVGVFLATCISSTRVSVLTALFFKT